MKKCANTLIQTPKALIFDLDGTLIDTEKIYSEVWPKAVGDMGYEMLHEQYLQLRSLGRPFAPARLKSWFGEDFDYDKARTIRKKYFDEYIEKNGIDAKTGVTELLDFLKTTNIVTAIATATDVNRATQYLKMSGLDGYFDRLISATMVDEGKPSPKVYEYACAQLGLSPADCIAVEDAPNGVISAFRAGLNVVMVPDLSEPDEELEAMLFAKVRRIDEIIGLLK